jgi:succinoglycan biosynthesis protein ExoA
MTPLNDVLVVIPCLNEEAHLLGLLDTLLKDAEGALIVVADGGSTDRSLEIAADQASSTPNVVLLHNQRRLQSAAINLAVAQFGEGRRWLVRVDAHCDYPTGYIRGLVEAAQRHDASSVVVPMSTVGVGCFQRGVAAAQNSVLGTGGSAHRMASTGRFVDHGHHALFTLADYGKAGGYDENFSHNEDAELDQRLAAIGARLWLEPSLTITYYPRRTPGALFRQYLKYGEGRARTIQRHKPPIKPRQLAPLIVAPAVAALILLPLAWLSPLAWIFALPAASWAALCLTYGALLGVKQKSVCVGLSGVAAMVMHLAWSCGFLRQIALGKPPGPPPPARIV